MIGYISGRVVAVLDQQVIIKTPSGVGYVVNVAEQKRYMVNENMELFILEFQREDKTELYGFNNLQDRQWTENLTKVSGVGPKSAATIIYSLGYEEVIEAITKGDAEIFTKVKGLGVKTAKKIVLELKGASTDMEKLDKMDKMPKSEKNSQFSVDFTDTLAGLGYHRGEIVQTITRLKQLGNWDENNLIQTVKKGLEVLGKN